MPIRKLMLIAAATLAPLLAAAHTHLLQSVPAANSSGAAPPQLMLRFSEATRLTALTLQRQGGQQPQKLGPLPAQAGKLMRLAAPQLEPGGYLLTWRGLAADGHVMSGTVRFTIVAR